MARERTTYARRRADTSITALEDPIYRDMDKYAGELLEIQSIHVKIMVTTAAVKHDSGVTFAINIRKDAKDLLMAAGYELPTERGEHPFAATVVCEMVDNFGLLELQIKTVQPKDGTPLQPVPPAPVAALPEKDNRVSAHTYPYHGDTVTVFSVREIGKGDKLTWQLEARASDDSLVRVRAWAEHNRMIQDAGYAALPARYAAKQTVEFDAMIEYSDVFHAYRIKHVYPKAAPVLTVVGKPVRVVIPVGIDPTWEDELRQLRAMIDKILGDTDPQPAHAKPNEAA